MKIFFYVVLVAVFTLTTKSHAAEVAGEDISAVITYVVNLQGNIKEFKLVSLLPQNIDGRQVVGKLRYQPQPTKVFSKNDNLYGEWRIKNPPKKFKIQIKTPMSLLKYDLDSVNDNEIKKLGFWEKRRYLQDEDMISAKDDEIKNAAEKIATGESVTQTAKNILDFVLERMNHSGFQEKESGSLAALKTGKGDCTDYVDLFVALCRAKGIPARHISGVVTKWSDVPGHSWAEFFDPKRGWVPVDPLHIDQQVAVFGRMDSSYIYLSAKRNDKTLNGGMLFYWKRTGEGKGRVMLHVADGSKNLNN